MVNPRKAAREALEVHRARNDRRNPMQRPLRAGDDVVNPGTHWRAPTEHGGGISGAKLHGAGGKRLPASAVEVIVPAHVKVVRVPTPPGRFEADPRAKGAGFRAAKVGRDVLTGKPWGRT